jgi:hypothetical protein
MISVEEDLPKYGEIIGEFGHREVEDGTLSGWARRSG